MVQAMKIKHLLRKLFFPYPSEDWDYMWRRCQQVIYGGRR